MAEKMEKTQKAPWLAMTLGGCCASRKDMMDQDDLENSRAVKTSGTLDSLHFFSSPLISPFEFELEIDPT